MNGGLGGMPFLLPYTLREGVQVDETTRGLTPGLYGINRGYTALSWEFAIWFTPHPISPAQLAFPPDRFLEMSVMMQGIRKARQALQKYYKM